MALRCRLVMTGLAALVALLLPALPALAASGPGAPCSDPTVSAINQYCENVPTSSGGNSAGPGAAQLAPRLSAGVRSRLGATATAPGTATQGAASAHGPRHRRHQSASARRPAAALLTLPAPGPPARLDSGTGRPSAASLLSGLVLALLAIGVLLGGVAAAVRLRGNPA